MHATTLSCGRILVGCLSLFVLLNAWPVATDAAPRKVTREIADQLLRSPVTPQDTALERSVKERLQAAGFAGTQTTAPGGMQAPAGVRSRKVDVIVRKGHVRMSAKDLTPQERTAAESAARGTAGVESWDWGN